jgi:hypothetical protein
MISTVQRFCYRARPLTLIMPLALLLGACAMTPTPSSAPTVAPTLASTAAPTLTAPTPTAAPTLVVPTPTVAPTLVVPIPTAAPTLAAPTPPATVAVPTSVPPTAVIPVEADAPGPGWAFALAGDANHDGVADAVFYWPAAVAPEVQFDDPLHAATAVAAEQIVIVQRSDAGLQTLLRIDRDGGWADQPLFDFAGRRAPAGYLLALDPARGPLVRLLPYGAGGADYGGVIGIDWNAGDGGFRVVAEHP